MTPSRATLARLYVVALVLRIIPVILARGLGIGLDDMFQYDMLARSLAEGRGYRWYAQQDLKQLAPYVSFNLSNTDYNPEQGVPTSFRAPLYPAFLAVVYFFSGTGFSRFLAARVAQAILLGAPLAPLTYVLAGKIIPRNEKVARAAGWIVAAYPMLLLYPLGLGTENLFFVLLLCSVLTLLGAAEKPRAFNFAAAGILLGLTALTRSVIVPFAGLAVLWTGFILKQRRGAIILALALALTVVPWILRNSLLYGRLTGIETSLGYNLYVGYHPDSTGTFTYGPSLDLVPILNDADRDQLGTEKAIQFMREQPGRFVPLMVSRLGHFFRLELRVLTYFYAGNFFGYIPTAYLIGLGLMFGLPFAILSIYAAFGSFRLPATPARPLLALLLVGYLLPHILILSEERFHLALIPFAAIAAAQFLGSTPQRRQSLWRKEMLIPAAITLLLLTNWIYQFSSEAAKYAVLLGPNGNHSPFPY
jgi:4-amino-4-deoxy-L-arabinose transferase-like glycosyltransferase